MVDVRLDVYVNGIDKGALAHMSNLILNYVLQNKSIGTVEIRKDRIAFLKFLMKKDETLYSYNNLENRGGIIYFTGDEHPRLSYGNAGVLLMNILRQLKPRLVGKLSI